MAERFEEAWRGAGEVDLASFLPPPTDPLRAAILEELIKTELEACWSRGRHVELGHYLQRFPELGDARTLSPQLIYEEYRARHRFGDRPPLTEYRNRFPDQFEALQQLVGREPVPLPCCLVARPPLSPAGAPPLMLPSSGDILPVSEGYKLIKRLGGGTFGDVWQAEAPGGMPVAIKIIFRTLDNEETLRELAALEVLKRLRHDHLLKIHAAWAFQDRLLIVMELADGNLRQRLRECKQQGLPGIPEEELLRDCRAAADALDYLHSQNVLHRDIKPDNILLLGGSVRVADFGLLRERPEDVQVSATAGTPAYMPPEVWRRQPCPQSDQYSLAYTYAELRLGRRPFPEHDPVGIMEAHLTKVPELEALPRAEQEVLLRALDKSPAARFASCLELVSALERALDKQPSSQPSWSIPVSAAPRLAPPTMRSAAPAGEPPLSASRHSRDGASGSSGGTAEVTRVLPVTQTMHPGSLGAPTDSTLSAPAKRLRPPVRRPGRPAWRMWLVVLGFLFVCLGSLALLRRVFQPSGPLKLQVPEVVALWPGCEKTIPVRRDRGQFRGEVKVAFSAPSGVTLGGPDTISADAEQVDVKVRVAPDAAPGLREVAVEGKAGRSRGEATLRLQIHWVPPGYGPVAEDDLAQEEGPGGARLYRRIVRPHKSSPVAMVLVPAARPPQEGAFYIMEHKLSNGIFRRFAQQVHEAVRGSAWERGGLAGGKDIGSTQDRLPVLRVTRAEAQRCAEWLGGRLPTVRQLDRAGSSTQPPIARRVAVNRRQQGPRAVDDPNGEVSPLGVRDLTGNGREWTRDVLRVEGEELAVLHGRSYTAPPLGPRPDSRSRPELTPTQYPTRASPYTGFRVVIEVPAPSS